MAHIFFPPKKSTPEEIAARKIEAQRIREKYPNRIPIIVEKDPHSKVPDIDRHKYLVPKDISVAQFLHVIRKRIHLTPDKAIFLFVRQNIPPTSSLIAEIDQMYRDEDLFLRITYSGESTFG